MSIPDLWSDENWYRRYLLHQQRQMLDFQSKIEFKPDKLYKGTKGTLKGIVFKVHSIQENGAITIQTAIYNKLMKFDTVELQEMEPKELA